MRIAFYRNIGIPFNGDDDIKGTGGLEIQAIGLGREFAKRGHEVIFYVHCLNPDVYDGVTYKKVSDYQDNADISIGIDVAPPESKGKRVSWTHTPGLDCYSSDLDFIVCNSPWTLAHYQRNKPSDNYIMIPNGFSYDTFSNQSVKKRNSIMFAGHPMKNMCSLPAIFKKVKDKIPSVTCDVYGGSTLWKQPDSMYQNVYDSLREAGINYHGLVPREELIQAFQTSEIYFLPRSGYTETFGLSVIEAMTAGCVPICSKKGNLTNLLAIKDSGVLLEYDESVDEAQAIIDLLNDEVKLARLRWGATEAAKQYDWPNVASVWEKEVFKI